MNQLNSILSRRRTLQSVTSRGFRYLEMRRRRHQQVSSSLILKLIIKFIVKENRTKDNNIVKYEEWTRLAGIYEVNFNPRVLSSHPIRRT